MVLCRTRSSTGTYFVNTPWFVVPNPQWWAVGRDGRGASSYLFTEDGISQKEPKTKRGQILGTKSQVLMAQRMDMSKTYWMYEALLVTTILLCQVIPPGDAGATLTVNMMTYQNSNSRDYYNQKCDVLFNTRCDNLFTFCLDVVNGNDNLGSRGDCRYGLFHTGEFTNMDYISFTDNMKGVPNPIIIRNIQPWQNVRLKVEVRDDDSSHSSHDLVDRFYRVWEAVPTVNNTNPPISTVVINGERTSSQPASLKVKFSVKCDLHYYGADCAAYCIYTDDSTGHYRCTNDGSKECLDGWEDVLSSCTVRADDCEQHNCQNGARCIDGQQSYTCQCPVGFTGVLCETDIEECESNPCANNGTCVDLVGGFNCVCPEAYPASLSPLCEIHTCLHDDPCQNGGTCYGAGLCQCPPNYTGSKCELHFCEKNCISCMNGGVCNGTACQCPPGTLGERCEVQICHIIECLNGGTCSAGKCLCPKGFNGTFCHINVDDCLESPCQNRGFCIDGIDSYSCWCQDGFSGDDCQLQLTTTTVPQEKKTKPLPNNPNVVDFQTDKPHVHAVKQQEMSPTMFMVMIILLVLLFLIIIVLIAILCRERVRRKLKEQHTNRPTSSPNSNFENPVYTMEGPPSQQNVYDYGGYLAPNGLSGHMMNTNDYVNNYEDSQETAYSHPPRGPPRSVMNQGEMLSGAAHPEPPPYSPTHSRYNRSTAPTEGAVSMNDIKARLEHEQTYEEIDVKVPLP